ncbi:MAG: phosphotransferase [Planctomycetaceae bacterium]
MNILMRRIDAWIDSQRLTTTRLQVADQLSFVLGRPVQLLPTTGGGGQDRIFIARTLTGPHRCLAAVRIPCRWKSRPQAEPFLPRETLSAVQRIARESAAYERLSTHGLAPRLIARSTQFLANDFLPWDRLSEVLRQDDKSLWQVLPGVLRSVHAMHSLGVSHMDLNCGNILISPERSRVVFIDFEYAPSNHLSPVDRFRFDYLRLAHNLLKPRRGRRSAFENPHRFVQMFAEYAPLCAAGIPGTFPVGAYSRLLENPEIAAGFVENFGIARSESNIMGGNRVSD